MNAAPPFPPAFLRSRKPLTRSDVMVILLVLLAGIVLSVRFWFPKGQGTEVVVYVDNQVRYRFPLTEEGDFKLQGRLGPMTLRLSGGKARITASTCPLKLCMKMGSISRPGQSLVCLPNRVVISIVGKSHTKTIDLITQ